MVLTVWSQLYGRDCMVATVWSRLYGRDCMVATAHKLSEGEHRKVQLRSEKILIFSKSMVRPWSEDGRDYA
jgi:hypothetical protein